MTVPFLDSDALKSLALAVPAVTSCACGLGSCQGWESVSDSRWPKALMTQVATLRDPGTAHGEELTFEEFHPQGTRYDSEDAPVAPAFFPYNRCDVFSCQQCRRLLLKYTEYGGYYVDPRVRALAAQLITP